MVTMMSAPAASPKTVRSEASLSRAIGSRRASAPAASAMAFSAKELEAMICAGPGVSPGITNSSPVAIRATTGRRAQGTPDYVDSVTEEPEDGYFGFDDIDSASDSPEERKYRQVCQLVFENQKVSASWIQRQMGVGYNTASKWIIVREKESLRWMASWC